MCLSAVACCWSVKSSPDAAVIGAGVTLFEALKAYDQLKADGINIRVIDAYSVQPIDAKTMIEAGKAVVRIIAERPVASSCLSTMS